MKRPAVLLDRDGTLIWDRPGHYLRRPEKLKFYKDTFAALKLLRRAGFKLVVVTNQSGLARGWITETTLADIHRVLKRGLKRRGASIDAIYYCVHAPEDRCACRKPKTVLATRAARDLNLDLKRSFVVGDKRADVDLARRIGAKAVHVKTGHGTHQRKMHGKALKPAKFARGVLAAAKWIVREAAR